MIEDDISWKLCIKNLYGKYNRDKEYVNDVKSAFRNEIHVGTKKQYFNKNTIVYVGICDNCNRKTIEITTDHYPEPYKKIFEKFVNNHNVNLCDIEVFENENNEIRIENRILARKWLIYHDKTASYRLLCNHCNPHFGSYGY